MPSDVAESGGQAPDKGPGGALARLLRARTEGHEEEEEEGGDVNEAEDDADDVEGGPAVGVLEGEERVVEEEGGDEEQSHPRVLEAGKLRARATQVA